MRCASAGCGVEFGFFNWKYKCGGCAKYFCSSHFGQHRRLWRYVAEFNLDSDGEGLCVRCADLFDQVSDRAKKIQLYSANYRGRVPYDYGAKTMHVSSSWHRNRDFAERVVMLQAAAKGLDLVFDLKFEKTTGSEPGRGKGTHYYSMWRASGSAGVRYVKGT